MIKPVCDAVIIESQNKYVINVIPNRRQVHFTVIDLMSYCETLGEGTFLGEGASMEKIEEVASHLLKVQALQEVVTAGIDFLYQGMKD